MKVLPARLFFYNSFKFCFSFETLLDESVIGKLYFFIFHLNFATILLWLYFSEARSMKVLPGKLMLREADHTTTDTAHWEHEEIQKGKR